jgi:hypothetical protein
MLANADWLRNQVAAPLDHVVTMSRVLDMPSVLRAVGCRVAAAAEVIDPEITTDLYDAEDAKQQACQMIYQSVAQLMARPPTFGEQLVSDLGMFLAYLVPLSDVERCASAQADYETALDRLRIQTPDS